jgi:hypothetical protein
MDHAEGVGGGRINDGRAQGGSRIGGEIGRRVKHNFSPGGGMAEAQLCGVQINAGGGRAAVKGVP